MLQIRQQHRTADQLPALDLRRYHSGIDSLLYQTGIATVRTRPSLPCIEVPCLYGDYADQLPIPNQADENF
jgi:hypothetical protein